MQAEAITAKNQTPEAQPLADIVTRLSHDLRLLAREETQLAKAELGEKLDQAKEQAATMAIGGAAVAGGALALVAAAILGLALVVPAWAAALLVGAVLSGTGALLVMTGKAKLSRISVKPERALEGVRRDVAAIKGAIT